MTIHAYQETYLSKAQASLGDAFDYAIAISPDDIDAYVHKARVKDEEGKPAEALELLNEVESRAEDEHRANIWVMKAYILFALKKKSEAKAAIWKSLEYVELNATVYLRAAYCFRDVEAYADEVTMLTASDEKEPDNIEVLNMLGEVYNDMGMFEEAAKTYERLSKLHDSPTIYALWGSCELSLGHNREAYQLFKKSTAKEPFWQSYILMTACDIEMSHFAKMEEDFRMAYALNPDGAVELLQKIAPDMMKQMKENGFIKRLQQQREKDIRKREKQLLDTVLNKQDSDKKNNLQ